MLEARGRNVAPDKQREVVDQRFARILESEKNESYGGEFTHEVETLLRLQDQQCEDDGAISESTTRWTGFTLIAVVRDEASGSYSMKYGELSWTGSDIVEYEGKARLIQWEESAEGRPGDLGPKRYSRFYIYDPGSADGGFTRKRVCEFEFVEQ
jgi:hypothetical protein